LIEDNNEFLLKQEKLNSENKSMDQILKKHISES